MNLKKRLCLLFALSAIFPAAGADGVKATLWQPEIPLLAGKSCSPAGRLELVRPVGSGPYRLESVTLSLAGTRRAEEVVSVALYQCGADGLISAKRIGRPVPVRDGGATLCPAIGIDRDTLRVWVGVSLSERISPNDRIYLSVTRIGTSRGDADLSAMAPARGLRRGVAVRRALQDGVFGSRIPGLVATPAGTLLAIFDARYESRRDLQGDMDIALHRSTDGGMTWQPMQVILDMGRWGGLPEKYNGVSDACIVADEHTGEVIVAACWMHGIIDRHTGEWVEGLDEHATRWEHQWSLPYASKAGWGVRECAQVVMTRSSDDGLTWSAPENVTRMVKPHDFRLYVPAPGRGVTLADGTLVLPTQGRNAEGTPFASVLVSRDGGRRWERPCDSAYPGGGECAVAELSDGSLMLNTGRRANARLRRGAGNGRGVTVSRDGGRTWTEHPTSCRTLVEPPCEASLLRHRYTERGEPRSVLLFCNPDSDSARVNLTLKVSFDDGATWPEAYWTVVDELPGSGYSCMASVGEDVGILFEGSQADLVFVRVPLDEILKRNRNKP